MAINSTDPSVQQLVWGDRSRDLFIDSMVKSAAVLNRFTLIDGVKAKVNVPIFEVTASAYGVGDSADCSFTDNHTANISEKEMSVETFTWGFKNCKAVLENSYRGIALKKGQHNPETMDVEFRNWVYDHFAKLAAQKALNYAGAQILAEMKTDADVIDFDTDTNTTGTKVITSGNILDIMQSSYEAMSDVMLSAVYGDADREFRPAFFLGTVAYQAFQIAMAEEFASSMTLSSSDGIAKGAIPTYYGMEVIHLSSLAADHLFVTPPSNLVMLTDDYNDVAAIDSEYEAKENSEYLWGRFKLGFSYLKGSEIVLAYDKA